jgi:hypothetical protein
VNLFKAYLEQVANDRGQTFNVSRMTTNDNGRKPKDRAGCPAKGNGKPNRKRKAEGEAGDDEDVKDRYYTPKEYAKLTTGQRKKLQKLRDGRQDRQAASTLTDIQKLTVAMAELTKAHEGKEKDSGEADTDADQAGGNRNNSALQRKKKNA